MRSPAYDRPATGPTLNRLRALRRDRRRGSVVACNCKPLRRAGSERRARTRFTAARSAAPVASPLQRRNPVAARPSQCAPQNSCQVVRSCRSTTREIAVDWRLTTQPNSDEQGDTQMKSRSPEVLTPQHSDNLGATQHNSAKLGQFRLLICGLWVRFPPGSPKSLTKTTHGRIERRFETLSETLTRQNAVKLRRGVCLERGQDVAVRVQRQRYLRVAERFHDRPRIDALRQ
jgi:hypothetical protein